VNNKTILVAEDEAAFRQELGRYLIKHGFAVISVEDGYQALEFAVRDNPDLLLLDVHMPAGDGFSVHERVAKHPELALVPVIYMTHDRSVRVEVQAEEHGAVALLHKPFQMEEMLLTVTEALGQTGAEAA
jgi:DNA-binding response OmpR family regulator